MIFRTAIVVIIMTVLLTIAVVPNAQGHSSEIRHRLKPETARPQLQAIQRVFDILVAIQAQDLKVVHLNTGARHLGPHQVRVLDDNAKKQSLLLLGELNKYDTETLKLGFEKYCATGVAKSATTASEDVEWSLYLANRIVFKVPPGMQLIRGNLRDYGGYLNFVIQRDDNGDYVRPLKADFLWPLQIKSDGTADIIDIPIQFEMYGYRWFDEFKAFNAMFGRRKIRPN